MRWGVVMALVAFKEEERPKVEFLLCLHMSPLQCYDIARGPSPYTDTMLLQFHNCEPNKPLFFINYHVSSILLTEN
jgi:hypothetical protein